LVSAIQAGGSKVKPILFVVVAFLLAGCAGHSSPAAAHDEGGALATSPQCTAPEFRQLDFWVGEWDVRWEAAPGQPAGNGANTIRRDLGNCVIYETFEGGPSTGNLVGYSVSTFHGPTSRWRQTWVDNQGGYFALVGGPMGDTFVLENSRLSDTAPYLRMVFEDITPTSITWRWQRSTDGGSSWSDSWVIHYTRRN
jgi:hypothetical protein